MERGKVIKNDLSFEQLRAALNARIDGLAPFLSLTLASFSSTGRGLMATQDIDDGDFIVAIPYSLLITSCDLRAARKRSNPMEASFSFGDLPEHLQLTLWILLARRAPMLLENSFQNLFCDLLPTRFETVPLTWPVAWIKALFPEGTAKGILRRKNDVLDDFRKLQAAMRQAEASSCDFDRHLSKLDCDFEEFELAWLCVNTRCISLKVPVEGDLNARVTRCTQCTTALAPFLDLLNHSSSAQCIARNLVINDEWVFAIRSQAKIPRSAQAFIHYGSHDNLFLFTEYGFVEGGNTNDSLEFDVGMIRQVVELALKEARINMNHLDQISNLVLTEVGGASLSLMPWEPSFPLQSLLVLLSFVLGAVRFTLEERTKKRSDVYVRKALDVAVGHWRSWECGIPATIIGDRAVSSAQEISVTVWQATKEVARTSVFPWMSNLSSLSCDVPSHVIDMVRIFYESRLDLIERAQWEWKS
ncbi:SET domain-containing protein [Gonapodya prolifera JEL478]|uniref:SET domain-containing protein n=1 Tax=Gonapodya prolifera (strain JEL478) TaxID=1344416 RepID=A0A139AVE8_GONPJ|nr:SET domain-containing protein [Gonapodya prolifera JEL478]|eukprot:KXS20698.1 SET domain-containing protein [Gonapodya prolifera JEL478]